jgi:hypothetical protein
MRITCLNALSAQLTVVAQKDMSATAHFMSLVRTGDDALAAGDASFRKVPKLRFRMLPFWIVTPETTHGASFQEHSCTDARTIVQGKALNVENNVCSVHCNTVRGDSIALDAAFTASAEGAGNQHDHRSLLASLSGLY